MANSRTIAFCNGRDSAWVSKFAVLAALAALATAATPGNAQSLRATETLAYSSARIMAPKDTAAAQEIAHARRRAGDLINNIRQKLDACGDKGMLALSSERAQNTRPSAPPERPALKWNNDLAEAAVRHSRSMAKSAFFDHRDPEGRTVGARVSEMGYRWRVVGENLAAGQESIDEAVRGWLLSTGHCEVMIDPRFTEFGLARIESHNPADPYGSYWTLVVAQPKGAPQPQLAAR